MDISKITNPEAKRFITNFLIDRNINKQFYSLVPENKFDFRMVNSSQRKSDSPRESLGHQVGVQQDYINGILTGVLSFKSGDNKELKKLTKSELLQKLQDLDQKLVEMLSDPAIGNKKVKVPWIKEPIPAVVSLWGLDSHEILHQGWNLAIMDHLNIERFPEFRDKWG